MKKRIRKKLKLKEYTEQGFRVVIQFDQENPKSKTLIQDFLNFTIDQNNLSCGGCTNDNQLEMFITSITRASTNEKHRYLIEQWIKKRPEVTSFNVGQLEKARQ
ncbi:MAG: DUF469 family protein [Deltaproteobacteria bacterium]|jgi:uncharacterized protein YggL (DUF469 family)|nr:DUF469 family protein [Deltaproteobacteria bacterium]